MDNDALQRDLAEALKLLPAGMIDWKACAERLLFHRKELERTFPLVIERMMPHVQTAIMEGAMGTLDKDGMELACIGALSDLGAQIPRAGD